MANDNILDVKYTVEDDGIYIERPYVNGLMIATRVFPKEVLIEAYNKYILGKE